MTDPTVKSTAIMTYTWEFEPEDYSRVARVDGTLDFVHSIEARLSIENRGVGYGLLRRAEIKIYGHEGGHASFMHNAGAGTPEGMPAWVEELLADVYYPAEADASTARWP